MESNVDSDIRQLTARKNFASRQVDSASGHVLVRRKPKMLEKVLDQICGVPLQNVRRFTHHDFRREPRIE